MWISDYVSDNLILILILLGFATSLISTVFMDNKSIRRMFALIIEIFLLSILVYVEFNVVVSAEYRTLKLILMAIRYTATPLIVAQILFAVIKKLKWVVFIPAMVLAVLDIVSIFTGIVFGLDAGNKLMRGPLGLLPYIVAGLYSAELLYYLFRHSARQRTETVPVIFFAFAFSSGLILPFTLGKDYAQIFCSTIAVSVFVYYVFSILQLTKRDALTGLLNRQAYYADVSSDTESITALISADMNGLKKINDNEGHQAGDEALSTLSDCFITAAKNKYRVYRVGGDEFVIVCRKASEKEVEDLCTSIKDEVGKTRYSCSLGYSYASTGKKSVDELLTASDKSMYSAKEKFYKEAKGE